ncbi:MAG: 3-hydroxyacyl-CoA dehydrogenase/enoyl-CoA hydratase family protein [Anaerolineales bacterium]
MGYEIKKVGVIGSGTMGAGIAALLAGIDCPVVLLDIPVPGTEPGDRQRNDIIEKNLKALRKAKPPQLYEEDDLQYLHPGNTEDDLNALADCDWIIEVIPERLDLKQHLMARLEDIVKPGAIVSSNTSGLSINAIVEGRGEDFKEHFLGTHFFNPPRYLKLLEIIPGDDTDPALVDFMMDYGSHALGKGTVLCKDTPNFIGNRFMSISGAMAMNYAVDHGYTVEEVDAITGPLIGRPKTGTFRLNDVVGVDVAAHVARNLYDAIPDDDWREVLTHAGTARVYDFLLENSYLGSKTGQGFYKTVRGDDGAKQFWHLDLSTLEYRPPEKPRFESVGKHRKVEDTGERIRRLINEDDRAAAYIWHLHAGLFAYAAQKLGEVADTIPDIDNAHKWGFAHELGPFEIWDAIGVAETIERVEADGYAVAEWVKAMVDKGYETFYQHDDHGLVMGYYDPDQGAYVTLDADPYVITLPALRADQRVVEKLPGASLLDMGDGVGLVEFHTKMNAIDDDIVKMIYTALERLRSDFDGLVIGNAGDNFSVGANLALMAMTAAQGAYDQIDAFIREGQNATQALRYAEKPVVTAPFGMVLGGGAEFAMSGWRSVAHVESYMGLVELGVGLVPGWGGCKEMIRRNINPVMSRSDNADVLPHLQKVFETIGTAKVAVSAHDARHLGFLTENDRIIMNRDFLLAEAKKEVLALVASGTSNPGPGMVYAAGRDALAALRLGAWQMHEAGYASEYDEFLGKKLAYVLTGGDLSAPQWVPEQYILDLERETLVELAQQPKTMERISHMLQTGKPLRN